MGVNHFIFNGESSLDHGIYVGGQGTFNAPQRDVKKVSIPGRNGDLIKDNGRWLNIEVPYNIVIMHDFKYRTDEIRAWLEEPRDYARLEDTYHPDFFRMARFIGPIDFETKAFNNAGKATIIFDCKPQRYLKSGEELQSVSKLGSIYNPTRFASKPLIRVLCSGDGAVTIGEDYTITLDDVTTYIDIDSEIQDCYIDGLSANDQVTLTGGFPTLSSGHTIIDWSGAVSGVIIKGRWYTV